MHTIADVLSNKGRKVYSISPDSTVREAVSTMARHNVGALLVLQERRAIGMFSERDVLWRIVHESRPPSTRVRDVMTLDPIVIRANVRVEDAMRLMTDRRVRHLPVMEFDQLIGVVSIGDLTKWVTRDLEHAVGELESYIHGPYVQTVS